MERTNLSLRVVCSLTPLTNPHFNGEPAHSENGQKTEWLALCWFTQPSMIQQAEFEIRYGKKENEISTNGANNGEKGKNR